MTHTGQGDVAPGGAPGEGTDDLLAEDAWGVLHVRGGVAEPAAGVVDGDGGASVDGSEDGRSPDGWRPWPTPDPAPAVHGVDPVPDPDGVTPGAPAPVVAPPDAVDCPAPVAPASARPSGVAPPPTDGRSRPDGPTFDESRLLALGEAVARADREVPRPRHRHRTHRLRRAVVTLGVVLVVLVAGATGYAWYLNHEIHRIDVRGLVDVPTSGADAGTENILMVGSTDRCALKVQNAAYGLCSEGVDGINSDVIMILHLDPARHSLSILSVPRDLFVPNARTDGANKVDAALYDGPSQLVAAINEDLGIPVQHYVVLNFDTFAGVVDALGGVRMYFPEPVYDAYSGLKVLTPGCLELDGFHALQVVRARHLQYKAPGVTAEDPYYWPFENQSDLARIRRDHEFLRVLGAAVAKQGLDDPITDQQLVSKVAPQLEVDSAFSPSDMIDLVLNFHSVNPDRAPQLTLPVQVDQFGSYDYEGGLYGDVEFPSIVQDQRVIDEFLHVTPDTATLGGARLPRPSTVTVSVLNGTGVTDQAGTTASALGALGFHTVGVGDSPPVGTEAETVVYYDHRTAAGQAEAQAVADSLSGAVITAYGPTTDGAEVTVVTGTQFAVDQPAVTHRPAATSSTTAAPSPTTTTTSPTASDGPNGAFLPPSAAATPLQPWDPRSCTPSGGEGP